MELSGTLPSKAMVRICAGKETCLDKWKSPAKGQCGGNSASRRCQNDLVHRTELPQACRRAWNNTAGVPVVFAKGVNTVIASGETIRLPESAKSGEVDYECELVVVIGKECKDVSREQGLGICGGLHVRE